MSSYDTKRRHTMKEFMADWKDKKIWTKKTNKRQPLSPTKSGPAGTVVVKMSAILPCLKAVSYSHTSDHSTER